MAGKTEIRWKKYFELDIQGFVHGTERNPMF